MGITNHSQPDNGVLIWSVFQFYKGGEDTLSVEDTANHATAKQLMVDKGIKFIEAEGMYKNVWELCFVTKKDESYDFVLEQTKKYNQESILVCHKHKHGIRKAELLYLDTMESEFIGYLLCVPKEIALKQDGWLYRPDVGNYWTTAPEDDTTVGYYGGLGDMKHDRLA